jgi:DNA-binding protein HU-beta
MNKTEMIDKIAERLGESKKFAGQALDAVLDEIMHQVANGEKVALPGFGTFEPVFREAREARNPATGGTVEVPEKYAPKFKAGATFKNACNT